MKKRLRAFSLIELLVAIVIVGVLGGMITAGITMHRNAGFIASSRIQFIQYESALKAYCREYGEMPPFIGSEEACWLNREGNSELLIKALSGCNPDGTPLSQRDREYLNPFGKRFYTFGDSDFFKRKDGTVDRSQIADAFNNTNICIIAESAYDNDTAISKLCLPDDIQKQIFVDLIQMPVAVFSYNAKTKIVIGNWAGQ
jgi:prepilin-type N-terminal cleavage/methylation domain-containing protein